MTLLSVKDFQDVMPQGGTVPHVPQSMNFEDLQKMGASSEITYTSPPPPSNVFDRVLQDVTKPIAEVPQVAGKGLYWLGDVMGASPHSPFKKLGDRMAAAGLLMKEQNQKYIQEKYPEFDQNILDDVVSGGPIVAGGLALGALLGAPAAAISLAAAGGGAFAADSYEKLREKGDSPGKATLLATAMGVPVGAAMNLGFGKFLKSTGPWFTQAIEHVITGAATGAVITGTEGSLQLATGVEKYEGKESLIKLMAQAAHDAAVWGVLGGVTGIPLAMANHNAITKGFEAMGMSPVEARKTSRMVVEQASHAAMTQVEKDLNATPEDWKRIVMPDMNAGIKQIQNDILDYDMVPKDLNEAKSETTPLEEKIAKLEKVKEEMIDLRKAQKGISDDERVNKVLKEQTKAVEDEVNKKYDRLEKEQERKFAKETNSLKKRENVTPEVTEKIYAEQEKLRDELQKQREAELETELQNLPLLQDIEKELGVLQKQSDRLSEQIAEKKTQLKNVNPLGALRTELSRLQQGFRQGRVQTKNEIKDVQSHILDVLKGSDLEANDKAKFMARIKNIQTADQLRDAMPEIQGKIQHLENRAEEREWVKNLKEVESKTLKKLLIEYQDSLKPVLDAFDFTRASKAKLLERAKTLEFFKDKLGQEEPLAPGEQRALDLAAKKSLSEMTHDEIRSVHDMVMQVVTEGLRKNEYLTNLKTRNHEERVTQLAEYLMGDDIETELDNFDKNSVERNKPLKTRLMEVATRLRDGQTLPEFMLKWSGLNDLFDNMHQGYQTDIELQQNKIKDIQTIHHDIDFLKVLTEPIEIKDLPVGDDLISLTGEKAPVLNDVIRIYAQSFDEGGRRHLENTMSITKRDALLAWFEKNYPKEAAAIQRQFKYFSGPAYEALDKVVVKMTGHHMEKVQFYDPIGNSLEDRAGEDLQKEMKLGSKGMYGRALPESGMTKSRVESRIAFKTFDYYGNLVRNALDAAHYQAMAPVMRDANKLLYDPRVMKMLTDKFGPDWVPMLHKWLQDVAFNGHQYDSYAARLAGALRRSFTFAKLLYNPISAGKVFAQMGPATTLVGQKWILPATRDYMMNRGVLDKMIDSKSFQMKNRYFRQERELADLVQQRGANALWQKGIGKKYIEIGMAMHQEADKIVTRITWLGEYRKQLAVNELLGGTDEQAVLEADRATRITHPMGGVLYLPDAFRGNEFQKGLTTFFNVQNKNFNLLRDANRDLGLGDSDMLKTVGKYVGIGLMPAIWIAALSFKRPPSAKEIMEEVANQTVGSDLYLGFLTRAIVMGRDVGTTTPWAAPLVDVQNTIKRKDKIRYALSAIDDVTGLGMANIYRMLTGQMFHPLKER